MTTTTRYAIELEPNRWYAYWSVYPVDFKDATITTEGQAEAAFNTLRLREGKPQARIVEVKCEVGDD